MNGKLETIAFLLVLIILCSIIAPTMNVFASTSKTIKITSTGITSRVVFTTNPDDPDNNKILDVDNKDEYFVNGQKDVSIDNYDGEIYVSIEPDMLEGGRITSIKINGQEKKSQYQQVEIFIHFQILMNMR